MKMTVGKKPSRSEAYALILDLKTGRRELTDGDVDALIRFFAPTLPKKAKSAEQWVAKAAADQYEKREYLQYVYVENGRAYASNGHRAHRCKTALADGYYDPATLLPVDFDKPYPNIKAVFPDRNRCEESAFEKLEFGALPLGEKKVRPLEYMRVPDSTAVARRYIMDAMNGAESGPVFYARGVMAGDSEFGDWVIMELRL